MARYRAERGSVTDSQTTPTVAPASDLQTRWREIEEHSPGVRAGGRPPTFPRRSGSFPRHRGADHRQVFGLGDGPADGVPVSY